MAQVAGKYGEQAPVAAVCCNACRTCATTNLISVGMAGLAGAGYVVARFAKRGSGQLRRPGSTESNDYTGSPSSTQPRVKYSQNARPAQSP